jgi:hypothetical protein
MDDVDFRGFGDGMPNVRESVHQEGATIELLNNDIFMRLRGQ